MKTRINKQWLSTAKYIISDLEVSDWMGLTNGKSNKTFCIELIKNNLEEIKTAINTINSKRFEGRLLESLNRSEYRHITDMIEGE